MNRLSPLTLLLIASCIQAPAMAQQVEETNDNERFSYAFDIRYRFEHVSQDNALRDADASTVRSRMTLEGKPVERFSLLLEVDNVSTLGSRRYDSFMNDSYRGRYSVVPDPVGTDLNQLHASYHFSESGSAVVGRQRIIHADQRFVGGVAWRQNEQTYDAARLLYDSTDVSFDYSYVDGVQRIFGGDGDSVQITRFNSESHLLHTSWKSEWGTFTGYGYLLDFLNAPQMSTATWGFGYQGEKGPWYLRARYATQSDYGFNPQRFTTHFASVNTGLKINGMDLALGYEELGSDGGRVAFSTPLSTLHIFQGWADLFLITPDAGIRDAYMSLSGRWHGVVMSAIYHDFRSAQGGERYGSEWNLIATYPFHESFTASVKYANYQRDSFGVNTQKAWFSLQYHFQ